MELYIKKMIGSKQELKFSKYQPLDKAGNGIDHKSSSDVSEIDDVLNFLEDCTSVHVLRLYPR
jgi:hypothetical protein